MSIISKSNLCLIFGFIIVLNSTGQNKDTIYDPITILTNNGESWELISDPLDHPRNQQSLSSFDFYELPCCSRLPTKMRRKSIDFHKLGKEIATLEWRYNLLLQHLKLSQDSALAILSRVDGMSNRSDSLSLIDRYKMIYKVDSLVEFQKKIEQETDALLKVIEELPKLRDFECISSSRIREYERDFKGYEGQLKTLKLIYPPMIRRPIPISQKVAEMEQILASTVELNKKVDSKLRELNNYVATCRYAKEKCAPFMNQLLKDNEIRVGGLISTLNANHLYVKSAIDQNTENIIRTKAQLGFLIEQLRQDKLQDKLNFHYREINHTLLELAEISDELILLHKLSTAEKKFRKRSVKAIKDVEAEFQKLVSDSINIDITINNLNDEIKNRTINGRRTDKLKKKLKGLREKRYEIRSRINFFLFLCPCLVSLKP